MSDNPIIIIGGGLGGLVTGALLAKSGNAVTVIEKNRQVGGGLQSYKRFGVVFDTGMHIFGGMRPGGNIRRICDYLGITDKFHTVDLEKSGNVEVFINKVARNYTLDFSFEGFVDSFAALFPAERANLEAYLNAIVKVVEHLDLFYLRPCTHMNEEHPEDFTLPANEFISKYVQNPHLQSLLAIFTTFYGGVENVSPAYLHSLLNMIFLKGACRVSGGYSTFATALVDCIKDNGGSVILGDEVTQILTADKAVTGVLTASGKTIEAQKVISAIPTATLSNIIDDKKLQAKSFRPEIFDKPDSLSAFIINIKLKKDKLLYSDRISFYLEDYNSVWKAYEGESIERFLYMTPPASEQWRYAETLNIIIPMHWDVVRRWENTKVGNRGADYIAFKEKIYKETIRKLSTVIPGIEQMVDQVDTSSPLTIRDYIGVRHGAMCGRRKDYNDPFSFLPVRTRIDGLLLTGQDVNLHGFCGVTLTAVQTVQTLLGKDAIIDKINENETNL